MCTPITRSGRRSRVKRTSSLNRRRVMRFVLALLLALVVTGAAAQGIYPSRPIRLLIGFPPGAGMDAVARPFAARMSELLGQPVVVENRPGAGGAVSDAAIARAA